MVLLLYSFSVIMLFPSSLENRLRFPLSLVFFVTLLFVSLLVLAQVNLKHRMLNGYLLSSGATINKGKPTMFVFEQAETFGRVFTLTATGTASADRPAVVNKRSNRSTEPAPNFAKEMVIGVAIPLTNKPPKLSISKVFVQDSTLTVRYIRLNDTTATALPQSFTSQPTLLLAIPKQTVLRTRLVENGKVVQTIRKRTDGE